MSDTPKTDAASTWMWDSEDATGRTQVVNAEFCRGLERRIAVLEAERDGKRAQLAQFRSALDRIAFGEPYNSEAVACRRIARIALETEMVDETEETQ